MPQVSFRPDQDVSTLSPASRFVLVSPRRGVRHHRPARREFFMSESATFREIGDWLDRYESFALLSHVRPDGDAIGSQLALGLALEAAGKRMRIFNDDGVPSNLTFMAESERVERPPDEPAGEIEVVIALDTGNRARLGEKSLAAVAGCDRWINLDHHQSNDHYGTLNHVDSGSPATGQIVYQLIRDLGLPMPGAVREAIYVGVSTDTGSFQYAATTAETHELAADLLRRGLDVGGLNASIYHNFPRRRVRLLGELMQSMEFAAGDRLAYWKVSQAVKDRLGARPEDTEGLIDTLRSIEGVVVAVFFEELADGRIRVSMRSKEPWMDVCRVCQEFGGGGHAMAAGARLDGPLDDAARAVVEAVERHLSERAPDAAQPICQ